MHGRHEGRQKHHSGQFGALAPLWHAPGLFGRAILKGVVGTRSAATRIWSDKGVPDKTVAAGWRLATVEHDRQQKSERGDSDLSTTTGTPGHKRKLA